MLISERRIVQTSVSQFRTPSDLINFFLRHFFFCFINKWVEFFDCSAKALLMRLRYSAHRSWLPKRTAEFSFASNKTRLDCLSVCLSVCLSAPCAFSIFWLYLTFPCPDNWEVLRRSESQRTTQLIPLLSFLMICFFTGAKTMAPVGPSIQQLDDCSREI